ncbi:MAG: molybdopterin-dependent oxidoreductase [Alphaproteobacteria bacterium]
MPEGSTRQRIRGYCALCRSRCGAISVVEDGRLVALEPDPGHPTGGAICAKGRAAPELVYSPDRLLHPMKRTRPKGDADPGWQRIGWDEALDSTARALKRLAAESGAESVAFGVSTPSGTALSDGILWIERLINAFGSPNWVYATELCNWHKDHARAFTFGVGVMAPDYARTGCVLFWGHNPSTAWLTHATGAAEAKARGAKLIVVDPRQAGLANKADLWLRVRPGSDGALALGVAGVMIEEGWYDSTFMRDWSNGPLLVHPESGRFLTAADLSPGGDGRQLVAWDEGRARPLYYDPASGRYEDVDARPALLGSYTIETVTGRLACTTAFALYRALCCQYTPERTAELCWLQPAEVRAMARMLHESGPVAYYGWTGVGQHTNATQTDRAIALVCALTGSFDAPGGNVIFERVPTGDVRGTELMPASQRAKTIGLAERPIGPPRGGWVTGRDFYDAVLTGKPYAVRGLVGFGANLLVAHADAERGSEALRRLEFFVHADLFMTPTAAFADIVLPVSSAWERDGLRVGFEVSQAAETLVQYRAPVIAPLGEARSDSAIVFALAERLGLGNSFWRGDIDAGYRQILAPSGVSLEALRAAPEGIRVPLETRFRKYAGDGYGSATGFATPTRKVEVYSELFLAHGQAPLPAFVEPAVGPLSRRDLARHFPLVLTSAKTPQYCHSQHRNLPRLRRHVPHPLVEMHPETAAKRGIAEGDWVAITTPHGRIRARARLRASLDARVVAGQHGWWQACRELGLPGYDTFGPESANYNAVINADAVDPISGAPAHRSFLCEVSKL